MKKIIFIFFAWAACIVFPLSVAALADASAQTPINFYTIRGPSGVGMVELFSKAPRTPGYAVKVYALADASQVMARLVTGEGQIGILPPNVAAKVASTGKNLQIAAIVGNGMLSLLTTDPAVKSIEDLKGRIVALPGQGATPEFVFRAILEAHGLKPGKDITLNFSLGPTEIAPALLAGRVSLALLPEPFVTQALGKGKGRVRKIGDIGKEWAKAASAGAGTTSASAGACSANFPMTAIVINGDFFKDKRQALLSILAAAKASIEFVNADPAGAGVLVDKANIGISGKIAQAAIPHSAYVFETAEEAKPAIVALFKAFLAKSPASIGGKLPPDSFYWH
jgi:NitT/TauT family transport system substrate-binding protein